MGKIVTIYLAFAFAIVTHLPAVAQSIIYEKYYKMIQTKDNKLDRIYLNKISQMAAFVGNTVIADSFDALTNAGMIYEQANSLHYLIENQASYKAVSALDFISMHLKDQRIVMINEAHYASTHRQFMELMLDSLFQAGFRYLAVEAINPKDSLLMERGYPLEGISGYYLYDPHFANMIRAAIRKGFRLVAYEAPSPDSLVENKMVWREQKQAENIYRSTFAIDSSAKVAIFAGYGHIYEKKIGDLKMMASYLQEYTKINPYTIDMVSMSYHIANNQLIENLFNNYKLKSNYCIFIDTKNENMFISESYAGFFDAAVVSRSNIPVYTELKREIVSPFVPCLIVIKKKNEKKNACPIFVLENCNKKNIDVYLHKGNYTVYFYDLNNFNEKINIQTLKIR